MSNTISTHPFIPLVSGLMSGGMRDDRKSSIAYGNVTIFSFVYGKKNEK